MSRAQDAAFFEHLPEMGPTAARATAAAVAASSEPAAPHAGEDKADSLSTSSSHENTPRQQAVALPLVLQLIALETAAAAAAAGSPADEVRRPLQPLCVNAQLLQSSIRSLKKRAKQRSEKAVHRPRPIMHATVRPMRFRQQF